MNGYISIICIISILMNGYISIISIISILMNGYILINSFNKGHIYYIHKYLVPQKPHHF